MKYIKVKQLQKLLEKQDPEAEIFIEVEWPKELRTFDRLLYLDLYKPRFHSAFEDRDGSKHVWLTFSSKLDTN